MFAGFRHDVNLKREKSKREEKEKKKIFIDCTIIISHVDNGRDWTRRIKSG
jgi:hypothetical protein